MEEFFKAVMAEYAYKCGREDEKKEWIGPLLPGTVELTIRVRDEDDHVEQVRNVVTFDLIRESSGEALRYASEETLAQIATKGILKALIESTTK